MKKRKYASRDSRIHKVYEAQKDRRKRVALSHTLADENGIALTDEIGRKLTEEYK